MADSVGTLIKITKQKIVRQRLRMVGFEKKLAELDLKEKDLLSALKEEKTFLEKTPTAVLNFMKYFQNHQTQMGNLKKDRDYNIQQLNIEQNRLGRLFREQKTYEVYLENKKIELEKEQEIRLQKNLDELTLIKNVMKLKNAKKA